MYYYSITEYKHLVSSLIAIKPVPVATYPPGFDISDIPHKIIVVYFLLHDPTVRCVSLQGAFK